MDRKKSASKRRMWRRVGSPAEGFRYLRGDGRPLTSQAALERIASLAIPPAWTEVEIAPDPTAKIQATGIDSVGRKQYIYSPAFVQKRARAKYRKVELFAHDLPLLRAITNEHLKQAGVGREKVLATMVRLMCRAYFRVGSERYAVKNKTFGLTTLKKTHLLISDNDLVFSYRGKRGIEQRRVVASTPLVEIMRELSDLPGSRLFRYQVEGGGIRDVTARDVNEYLREILGRKYTSKDIRTWGGTVRAAVILADIGPAAKVREAEKNVVLTCKLVASELGNTPAVCRGAYIHPLVLDGYLKGKTIAPVMRAVERPVEAESPIQYYPEEAALMRFLQGRRRNGRSV